MRPGQPELADWLEQVNAAGPVEWVQALGDEVEALMSGGDLETAVRLLEQATGPSSPMFPALTGPKGKQLGARVRAAREGALGEADPWWEARLEGLLAVLDQWVRYKRVVRKRVPAAEPRDRTLGDLSDSDTFYQNWVLQPFRQNLRRLLEDRKISRKQFCEDMGISQAYLSQILRGIRSPSLSLVSDVSRVLEIHIGRLFAVQHATTTASGATPEPGDTRRWYPGKVGRPYAALEAHYQLVFYPGPAVPEEKIPARCHLIVDSEKREPRAEIRYVLRMPDGRLVVASVLGGAVGERGRFVGVMGETVEVGGEGAVNLGRVRGVLVEY